MNREGIGTLDFSATRGEVAGERMEPKVCEFCGELFFRPQPSMARLGQKHCGPCVKHLVDVAMAPIPKADYAHSKTDAQLEALKKLWPNASARKLAEWVMN